MTSLVFLVYEGKSACSPAINSRHKHKTIIRATAAKEAHARRRRARTAKYQADKAAAQAATVSQCSNPCTVLATTRADPFASFSMALTSRDKFLFDHYITILIPHWAEQPFPRQQQQQQQHQPRGSTNSTDRRILYDDMARLAVTDAGLLTATMLAACRHLARHVGMQPPNVRATPAEYYLNTAMEYKARCVKSVIDDISRRSTVHSVDRQVSGRDAVFADRHCQVKQVEMDNVTLAKIMVLVLDEIWLGDIAMARHHVLGAMKIVDLDGGPRKLPEGSFVASMLETFLCNKQLSIQPISKAWSFSSQEAGSRSGIVEATDRCVNPCETMASQFFHDRNQSVKHRSRHVAEIE